MSSKFTDLNIDHIQPQQYSIAAKDLISGNPVCSSWALDENMGFWGSTKGKWRFKTSQWECFRVLFGIVKITETATGEKRTLKAGDIIVLEQGFEGIWETVQPMRKHYICR